MEPHGRSWHPCSMPVAFLRFRVIKLGVKQGNRRVNLHLHDIFKLKVCEKLWERQLDIFSGFSEVQESIEIWESETPEIVQTFTHSW